MPYQLFFWPMQVARLQIEAAGMFWSMMLVGLPRPKVNLTLVANNPFLTRSEHRAVLTVVR